MSNSRWMVCLHESGHAVAAIVLGGKCHRIVVTAAGGECRIDGLRGDDSAFMTAAGPAAERLLRDVPTPDLLLMPAGEPTDSASATNGDTAPAPTVALSQFFLTDDQNIASWAVRNHEAEPERWAPRVYWARSVADAIVRNHAKFIVSVAAELFLRGSLTESEILSIQNSKEEKVA